MKTLLLDDDTWDLTVDVFGNIATATNERQVAQDVASVARLFLGELWYDTTQGIPYFQNILGRYPSIGFLMAKYGDAALSVPGVDSVQVDLLPIGPDRTLRGTITSQLETGAVVSVKIGVPWYVNAVSVAPRVT